MVIYFTGGLCHLEYGVLQYLSRKCSAWKGSEKNLGSENIESKKFGSKKCLPQNILGPKKDLALINFRSKKILGAKTFGL